MQKNGTPRDKLDPNKGEILQRLYMLGYLDDAYEGPTYTRRVKELVAKGRIEVSWGLCLMPEVIRMGDDYSD